MSGSNVCEICKSTIHPQAYYCKRCKKLIDRVDKHSKVDKAARKQAHKQALKDAWDGEGFLCHYSHIRLIENDREDPRYLTFDHRTPGDENDIVVAAFVLNDMKTNMTEGEFRAMVFQLANHFKGGTFDERVFNLKYWKR